MKKKSVFVLLISSLLTVIACGGVIKKSIRSYMPTSKYRAIVVAPFKTESGNPLAGEAAADAFAAQLTNLGFMVTDRKFFEKAVEEKIPGGAQFTLQDITDAAKGMGISAIITGQVTESGERTEKVAGYIQSSPDTLNNNYQQDRWGRPMGGNRDVYAKGEGEQTISKFSATAKMTDVQSGAVVWGGSIADSFTNSTIQSVANSVMERMAMDLGKRLKSMKY